jgi:hypothetical protein
VKDAYGCVFNALDPSNTLDNSVTINVYQQATLSFDAEVPPFTAGSSLVTFTNTSSTLDSDVFEFNWDFDAASDVVSEPASAISNDKVITANYSTPGIHEIILSVTNKLADSDDIDCVSSVNKIINIVLPPLCSSAYIRDQ